MNRHERRASVRSIRHSDLITHLVGADVKLDDLDALVDLHLGCAIQLVQAALPTMRAQRFGRVVLLSSRAALGLATRTNYSATKAGMLGMARTWALELAPEGITVNVVAPGATRTPTNGSAFAAPGLADAIAGMTALGRLGVPAAIRRAVADFTERYVQKDRCPADDQLEGAR